MEAPAQRPTPPLIGRYRVCGNGALRAARTRKANSYTLGVAVNQQLNHHAEHTTAEALLVSVDH